jgi:hypothetical protein
LFWSLCYLACRCLLLLVLLRSRSSEFKELEIVDAGRIEVPGGDLHQNGGLNGQLLDQARAAFPGSADC